MGFIELINLRKELAKAYGSKDFVEYGLKQDELSQIYLIIGINKLKNMNILNNKRRKYANKF